MLVLGEFGKLIISFDLRAAWCDDIHLAVLPIYLTNNTTLGPHQISIIVVYFLISAGITTLATTLIIYRIFDVSRRSSSEMSSYQYTIEILVESGLMYTTTIVITAVLLAIGGSSFDNLAVFQASQYFGALLTPMTVSLAQFPFLWTCR